LDGQTGVALRTLTGHSDYVLTAAFSPDGKMLASSTGGFGYDCKLWDIKSGAQLDSIRKFAAAVSFAFSPNSKVIASGEEGIIRLLDIETGAELKTLVPKQKSYIWSVAFSPDGKTLVSGGSSIHIWDVESILK
jgi:WD40 repeat protein